MSNKKQAMPSQKPLTFFVKKLGSIQSGEFTQKPLTIFCGPNNSGKTWAMYALHSFHNLAKSAYEFQRRKMSEFLDQDSVATNQMEIEIIHKRISAPVFKERLNDGLAEYFNSPNEPFQGTKFECTLQDVEWFEWLTKSTMPDVFLMPAERNGLHLFYRELSSRRTALLHHASKKDINLGELLRDVTGSPYAKPIADYIDWLNGLSEQRMKADTFHNEAQFIQKKLAQGRYHLNRQTNALTYTPYVKKGIPSHKLGLHAASSTVKSLFGLWFYLEHQAKAGDILMIDEPELNVHPKNQLLIAHLLARLVNAGIQVVLSTHSDYIVREFNNLILLSEDSGGGLTNELNKKRGATTKYAKAAILKPEQVGMYLFDEHTIEPCKFTQGEGFEIKTFDEAITSQNDVNNTIYHGLIDKNEDE